MFQEARLSERIDMDDEANAEVGGGRSVIATTLVLLGLVSDSAREQRRQLLRVDQRRSRECRRSPDVVEYGKERVDLVAAYFTI